MDYPEWQQKSPLILVIDDDRLIRQLIRQAMVKEGYEVIEAGNGEEALKLYISETPDSPFAQISELFIIIMAKKPTA